MLFYLQCYLKFSIFFFVINLIAFLATMQTLIKYVEKNKLNHKLWPAFSAGDTVKVYYEIREGTKFRLQYFKGIVIQCRGKGTSETFSVRKISGGVGIERIFFVSQPNIQKIDVPKQGKVRQARIYYFSLLKGKKARIKDDIPYLVNQ